MINHSIKFFFSWLLLGLYACSTPAKNPLSKLEPGVWKPTGDNSPLSLFIVGANASQIGTFEGIYRTFDVELNEEQAWGINWMEDRSAILSTNAAGDSLFCNFVNDNDNAVQKVVYTHVVKPRTVESVKEIEEVLNESTWSVGDDYKLIVYNQPKRNNEGINFSSSLLTINNGILEKNISGPLRFNLLEEQGFTFLFLDWKAFYGLFAVEVINKEQILLQPIKSDVQSSVMMSMDTTLDNTLVDSLRQRVETIRASF